MKINLCIIFLFLVLCSSCNDNQKQATPPANGNMAAPMPTALPPPTTWQYEESKDRMDNSTTQEATLQSLNNLFFESPYEGGSYGQIILRKMKGRNDAILKISKGQFNSSISGTRVRIKFNNGSPQNFIGEESSDGDSKYLFITPASKFIQGLKKSDSCIIQVEFFREGVRVLEFNCKDLKF